MTTVLVLFGILICGGLIGAAAIGTARRISPWGGRPGVADFRTPVPPILGRHLFDQGESHE